ncbi:MAG TPA: protein-glutamate O-methyltransferase CheR [Bryobacteraceae bacterium]|nr:protein-glutamate O-methyltransferase CheR [Bryobacteraceae bacterium]
MPDWSPAHPVLTAKQFYKIQTLVYEKCGIDLKHGKEELVKARLGKELRKRNLASFDGYIQEVENDRTGEALIQLINALSTNFTHFFREPKHFEILRKHVAPLWSSRKRADIWCAAAATGEEPYSILFSLLEELGSGASIRLLASDISTQALATAQAGIYPEERLAEIPSAMRSKYFLRGVRHGEALYRVKPEVRQLLEFRRINLIEPISHSGQFQTIFCRNVMIYFDKSTQEKVVRQLSEWLEPGGHLFVGHAESLNGVRHSLQYVAPAVYRKPAPGAAQPERRVG